MMRFLKVLFAILIVAAIIVGAIYWLRRHRVEPPPTPTPFETKGKLQIYALDVGQGDGFLIVSPGGKTVLIDAGSARAGDDVVSALQRRNIRTIDLAVATHPHADHIAGFRRVIGKLTVKQLLDSGQDFESDEFDRLKRAAKSRKVEWIVAKKGRAFDLDSGVRLETFNPRGDGRWLTEVREGGSVENANSVALRLSYGNFAMIFTGDAEAETEADWLRNKFQLRAQVLKVGHHGSRHATSEKFLNVVAPNTAIISCGTDNRYGHPSQPTLDRLKKAKVEVHRTDLSGEISIISDGNTYQVSGQRQVNTASLWQGRVEELEKLLQPQKAAATKKLKKEEID
ncbi:MAG: ComEC/Rec2 family competence protein [Blastocatellia bacterium]